MSNIAIVEIQTQSGSWLKFGECSSHPSAIKRTLDAALQSQAWIRKVRAVDSVTKQLIDMAFKN